MDNLPTALPGAARSLHTSRRPTMPAPAPDPRSRASATLREIFGYAGFRGAQAEIVAHVADGGDAWC